MVFASRSEPWCSWAGLAVILLGSSISIHQARKAAGAPNVSSVGYSQEVSSMPSATVQGTNSERDNHDFEKEDTGVQRHKRCQNPPEVFIALADRLG